MAERYADGLADDGQLQEVSKNAGRAAAWAVHADAAEAAAWAAARKEEEDWAKTTAKRASFAATQDAAERRFQSNLLRDIVGNPYRPAVVDLSWATPAVTGVARTVYSERALECLPRLADVLKEAGCHDADILAPCRKSGGHVRGC